MKAILSTLIFLFATSAVANSDLVILTEILSSEKVAFELGDREIKSIDFQKTNKATTWTYRVQIKSVDAGIGRGGPSSPCVTDVLVSVIGGIVPDLDPTDGPNLPEPEVITVCTANEIPPGPFPGPPPVCPAAQCPAGGERNMQTCECESIDVFTPIQTAPLCPKVECPDGMEQHPTSCECQ